MTQEVKSCNATWKVTKRDEVEVVDPSPSSSLSSEVFTDPPSQSSPPSESPNIDDVLFPPLSEAEKKEYEDSLVA